MQYLLPYISTLIIFLAIDFVWLGVVARNFYRSELDGLLLEQFNMPAALVFYAIFVVGIVIFAVAPALDAVSWQKALFYGALFGFFTYLTYDMTNLATLKNWSQTVVVVDVLWGTLLTAVSAVGAYHITRFFQ